MSRIRRRAWAPQDPVLAATDIMVAHCIERAEAIRQEVMRAVKRPAPLSRRLVAQAINLLLT